MKKKIHTLLEEELIKEIDERAKDLGLNRTAYVTMVLTKAVKEGKAN